MNQPVDLQFYVNRDPTMGFAFNLYALSKDATAEPLVMKERHQGQRVDPFASVSQEEAQMLMDALWTAGLRPTAGHGSAGEREAMRAHLEDLRRVVNAYLATGRP